MIGLMVTVFGLGAVLINQGYGCEPIPSNVKTRYCSEWADIAVRVRLLSVTCNGTKCPADEEDFLGLGDVRIVHKFRVLERFLGKKPRGKIIFTLDDGYSSCSLALRGIGKQYFIVFGGTFRNPYGAFPKKYRSLDQGNQPLLWKDVTKEERKFLRRSAQTNGETCLAITPFPDEFF